jgi:3-oxoacyl-[acyl-carrier-protein] synthase III
LTVSTAQGVAVRGIVACVPSHVETFDDLAARFGADAARRVADATGIESRRLAEPGQCFSDLAYAAAAGLLADLGWAADSVDALIVVTQTPDYKLPGVAPLLQHRLGLSRGCAAFDVGLGCSGYVYGLWLAAHLIAGGAARRVLLSAGDATSQLVDKDDRATAPLFGDAATATALERDDQAPPMTFALGTDGAGAPYLTAAGGGARRPDEKPRLFMDGTQVFAFTLREAPANIAAVLAAGGHSVADMDFVVLHQANRQMLERLARKIGATPEQTVLALADYGNTSSASIPLAICSALQQKLSVGRRKRLLLSGFGVGWSWGAATLSLEPTIACRVTPPGE